MTIEWIMNDSKDPYAGHIGNILKHAGVTDEALIEQMYNWWITEGKILYGKIKSDNDLGGILNKDVIFRESGKLAKAKLLELGIKK